MRKVLLLCFVFVLASCAENKKSEAGDKKDKKGPIGVVGYVVKSEKLVDQINVPGYLIPFEEVNIQPEVSGKIVYLNIPEGKYVPKGTLLVRLNDDDLNAQKKKLEAQKAIISAELKRNEALQKINGISMSEYEASQQKWNNLLADIEIVETALRKTQIRAPFNGTLGPKMVSVGAVVNSNTVIAKLQQLNPLKLKFSVPEKYNDLIKVGSVVPFTSDMASKTNTAKVFLINPSIDVNTRNLEVYASLPNAGQQYLPGSFANVALNLQNKAKAILVPTQAIIPEARAKRIAIIRGGKVAITEVTTGSRTETMVEITNGVNVGDTIAITGIMQLKKDGEVKITSIDQSSNQ